VTDLSYFYSIKSSYFTSDFFEIYAVISLVNEYKRVSEMSSYNDTLRQKQVYDDPIHILMCNYL